MKEQLVFHSYSANDDFALPLDQGFIFIFGGNGCGKTTLSRCFSDETSRVFNSDFINKNIFITDAEKGAKIDQTNRKNFSALFIGEEAVKLAGEIKQLHLLEDQVKTKTQEIDSSFKNLLAINQIDPKQPLPEVPSGYFLFNQKNEVLDSIEAANSHYQLCGKFEPALENDTELERSAKQLKEKSMLDSVVKAINEDPYLKATLFDQTLYISENRIKGFNRFRLQIQEQEAPFSKYEDKEAFKKWLNDGVHFEEENTECVFCGSDKGNEARIKWSTLLNSRLVKAKTDLIEEIEKHLVSLKTINKKLGETKSLTPNLAGTCEALFNALSEIKQSIVSNKVVELPAIPIKIDEALTETATVSQSVRNYLLNKHYLPKYYYFLYDSYLKKGIETKNKQLDEALVNYSNGAKTTINECLQALGSDKKIKFLFAPEGMINQL
jgi:hypothetical protein